MSFGLNRYTVFGHCLKMLKYVSFHTICYMEFWSSFENLKICVVSYHIYHCKSIGIPLQFAEDRDTIYITPNDVPYQKCHTIMSYTRKQGVSIIGYRGIVKVGCNSTAKNFAIFGGISGSVTSIFITNITFYNSIITAVNVELFFQHVALLNVSRIYTNATSYSAGFNLNCSSVSIHLVDTRISGSKECNQYICYGLAGIFIRNCSLQEF